jgi:iron complex transport system substrate-binding protein
MRIVSLLPSATEICFALGAGDDVVGVSHECDHPDLAATRPVLTSAHIDPSGSSADIHRAVQARAAAGLSLYEVDENKLRALRPDLIITQDTCRVCAVSLSDVQTAVCRLVGAPVTILSLSPLTLNDVFGDITRVGRAVGRPAAAHDLVDALRGRLDRLRALTAPVPRPRVLVLEWLDPPMVGGHWTPELIRIAGGEPVLGWSGQPTRASTWPDVAAAAPEVVLLVPCGYPIEKTRAELPRLLDEPRFRRLPAVASGRLTVLDGNAYFNRPGPRLVDSAELAAATLHPDLFR